MTVDPFTTCSENTEHVLPNQRYYPAQISLRHQQLRHFISSPQSNILYYANKRDVYSLNTVTRKRTQVAELPFETRCTTTGYGWFCAGGDNNGYFAAFRLPESLPSSASSLGSSSLSRYSIATATIRPRIRVESLGDEIVNSVSVHILPTNEDEDEVVAVITENDRSVRMYSLSQDCEIYTKYFPFNMNHATISPDGKLLVAVGDKEHIYFYERQSPESGRATSKRSDESKYIPYKWNLLAEFELHRPQAASCSGYFTTAWSPSSSLCATASEQGYITVFDVETVRQGGGANEAVLCVIPSSQPSTQGSEGEGAVRTMCFSYSPWDLLIWSEASGRVCIGDLRNGLKTRQVIDLDHEANHVQQIEVCSRTTGADDLSSMDDLDSDLLRRPQISSDTHTERRDHLERETALDRRISSGQNRPADADYAYQGLSDEERLLIERIRTSRQRQDRISNLHAQFSSQQRLSDQGPQSPRNSYSQITQEQQQYRALLESQQLQSNAPWRMHFPGSQISTSQMPDLISSTSPPIFHLGSRTSADHDSELRNNPRDTFPSRTGQPATDAPALRSSINNTNSTLISSIDPWQTIEEVHERATFDNSFSTGRPPPVDSLSAHESGFNRHAQRTLERVREQELRLTQRITSDMSNTNLFIHNDSNGSTSASSPTTSIPTSGTNITIAEAPLDGTTVLPVTRLRLERARALETHQENERRRRILLSSMEPSTRERLRSIRDSTLRSYNSQYFGTAGVALSVDGRTLYAATHQGIFELRLNYHSRKFFAAVEPR